MAETETIQIYIVDDHAILREGLKALIATDPGMIVVGEAADGEEASSHIKELKPDVILLDLKLPNKGGLEVINETIRDNPQVRILVLTNFADDDKVLATIQAGALGYLLKDTLPDELLKAIRDVSRGESHLHPVIARKVIRQISKQETLNQKPPATLLTARELEILTLVSQGLSNQEIADDLLISERTVRTHVSNILEKLHLASRTQALLYALREGFAKLEPS
jgi:NarL family two-component system response regulator LiaR